MSEVTIPHDQLFKELLRECLADFLQLFFPQWMAELDLTRVTFLEKEFFTDFPGGRQREPDLIAEVRTRSGKPQYILFHLEVEARRRRTARARMCEYYALIRLRTRKRVMPVLIYLSPGSDGLTWEIYTEELLGEELVSFRYAVVGLRDLSADEYRTSDNPVGIALSSLMKDSAIDQVSRKYDALVRVARARINESKRLLLTNVVESYLRLDTKQEQELQRRIAETKAEEVTEMVSIYELRGIQKGIQQGIEQGKEEARKELTEAVSIYELRGIQKGIEQGIQQGKEEAQKELQEMIPIYELRGIQQGKEQGIQQGKEQGIQQGKEQGLEVGLLDGRRAIMLRQLRVKFGILSDSATSLVGQMNIDELDSLAERVLFAPTLEEALLPNNLGESRG